jgi:hypothetical protein
LNTIPSGTTASTGYLYGTQGKFTLAGTVSGSVWASGLLGQLDISSATLTSASHVTPVWSDAGATGPTGTCAFCDSLVVTNTLPNTTFNSVLFAATKAGYFVDAANSTNSGGWIASSSASANCTTTYLLKINTAAGAGYIHVCSN